MDKILLTTSVLLAMLFIGCNKDNSKIEEPEFGERTQVTVHLQNQIDARSGKEKGSEAESKINWLEFYVFDNSGKTRDPEVGKTDTQAGNGYIKVATSSMAPRINVSAGTKKKIIVVANATLGELDGLDFEQVKDKLSSESFKIEDGHNSMLIPNNGLEMSGYTEEADVLEGVGNNQVYMTINRLVSRINPPILVDDIEVELTQDQIDVIWEPGSGLVPGTEVKFQCTGFAIINGNNKSTVSFTGNSTGIYNNVKAYPWSNWDFNKKERVHLTSKFDPDGNYTNNYSGNKYGDWFLKNDDDFVYVYESKPLPQQENNVNGYHPQTVISYIIRGELSAEGVQPQTRFWRVDITKTDVYHIMRNCVYKVTINKITTPGYGTPEEAEKPIVPEPDETLADFIISVDQWDINEYETQM